MNLNVLLSVPIIAFSLFALIAEVLGFELVFHRSRISLARSETTLDRMSIQTMLLSTVVYAGSIASTSGITLVESLTWLRPGNAMAPLLGYVFGIPGCVGVGLGNLLADSFSGYFTHASLGGFLANFMLAYIPYKVLSDPPLRRVKEVAGYLLFVVLISTFVSGYVIVGLFDLVSRAGFTNPIPVIGGIPPPTQVLSESALWGTLFVIITTNNVAMNLVAGVLIVATFRYFSEKGLFWKDRAGLFPAEKGRVSFLVLLAAGVALCYVVYDLSVRVGVYGKIGRSQNYVDNLLGILFFVVGLVGVVSVSTNSVKNRILSILIGSRSVDARALEVYLAARRDVLKKQAKDEITGERLGTLLFARILEPSLGRLLGRIRVQIFVDDYLEHIMLHMMNSKCSVKKGQSTNSRTVIIEECVVCEGISSQAPACELVAGFLKGLVEAFLGLKGDDSIAFAAETECKATGKEACRIDLGWE